MDIQNQTNNDFIKMLGIGALSLGINYLIFGKLLQNSKIENLNQKLERTTIINEVLQQEKEEYEEISHKRSPACIKKEEGWGSVKLLNGHQTTDPLLRELRMMDSLLFEVSRVNHLIVDLELKDFKPLPNHLVCHSIKKNKEEPYLSAGTLIAPGEFILKQSKFTPSKTLELEKKYLRAGPRATDFFKPSEVRADIVCLGGVCPGINTVIREIVIMLKDVSKVDRVTGVKNSLKGYYDGNFIDLNEQIVKTIHHNGGCFLGLSKTEFNVNKIVDSLVDRGVNQLYIIGANKAMEVCQSIHKEIKKRRLAIAVCVLLKGINRDIPIFDSCFGFETAVEESSKVIEKAYAYSHSQENGISLVKLHGYNSGFLASHAVLSTVNANVCLVPEFEFDMYGPKGLLASIIWRIKNKGSCTIVYSDGTENAVRDSVIRKNGSSDFTTEFDSFMCSEIKKKLNEEGIAPFSIGMFNGIEIARTCPANAIDTKLCCQIAQSSIMGVMSGYTNFAIGHLASKSTMISVDELILSETKTQLKEHDDIWQQTVMSTGQPRLLNDQIVIKTP